MQGADHDSGQVTTNCMQTRVILRIMLQHFSNAQLLKLSLVNKLWNHEARSWLKDRGTLTATIRSQHPCLDVKSFASDLQLMNIIPFSGIAIDATPLGHRADRCLGRQDKGPGRSTDIILDCLQLKHVSAVLTRHWDAHMSCPAFLLVKKILNEFGGTLEKLSLTVRSEREEFIQDILQDCRFPSLKILELQDKYETATQDYTKLIKALVTCAPKLQELHTQGPVDLKQNLLEGSSAVLVTNRFTFKEIGQDLSLERVKLKTPTLLQISRTTLSAMEIDVMFLAPLMCYGICLENVTDLQLCLDDEKSYRPRIQQLMKTFDFTRIFPRLTRVLSLIGPQDNVHLEDQILEIVSPFNLDLIQSSGKRAVNIKDLRICFFPGLQDGSVGCLPDMVPHIEKLSVEAWNGKILPGLVWEEHWPNLKELEVAKTGYEFPTNENFDSAFCGIFREEVAELRQKDEDYLKAVNIVPIMPSIVSLKGLRSFTFKSHPSCFDDCDPAYMFSKVTGLVAFKRCPYLSVTLKSDYESTLQALSHMKPYARVCHR